MEIADVKTYIVGTPPPHKGGRNWVFVRLTTDTGIEGIGECNWAEYQAQTLVQKIEELANPFILGMDPFNIEEFRKRMYHGSHFLHISGPTHAQVLSAIEMACWDIIGKHLEEPIYNLLGGVCNDQLRSYTYLHYKWNPPQSAERAASAAKEYVEQGFTAIKVDPIYPITGPRNIFIDELSYAEDVIQAISEAVGDRCDILLGTHGQLHTHTAIRLAKRLEPYDLLWFEEPVPPENIDEMAKVARATSIPIAAGERIMTKHRVAKILEKQAASIIQLNIGLTGLLAAKQIAGLCEAYYAQVAPWMYCGPVAQAANLQLGVCSSSFLIQESIETGGDFHDELLVKGFEWEDGYIRPPTGPGLGIELDQEVISAYPYNDPPPPSEVYHYSAP